MPEITHRPELCPFHCRCQEAAARVAELEGFARYVLEMDPDSKAPLFERARAVLNGSEPR